MIFKTKSNDKVKHKNSRRNHVTCPHDDLNKGSTDLPNFRELKPLIYELGNSDLKLIMCTPLDLKEQPVANSSTLLWRTFAPEEAVCDGSTINRGMRDASSQVLRYLTVWYNLPSDVFFLAVSCMDSFLAQMRAQPKHLSCIAVASFHLASRIFCQGLSYHSVRKIEGSSTSSSVRISPPDPNDLVTISQSKCSFLDLFRMQDIIIEKLHMASSIKPIGGLVSDQQKASNVDEYQVLLDSLLDGGQGVGTTLGCSGNRLKYGTIMTLAQFAYRICRESIMEKVLQLLNGNVPATSGKSTGVNEPPKCLICPPRDLIHELQVLMCTSANLKYDRRDLAMALVFVHFKFPHIRANSKDTGNGSGSSKKSSFVTSPSFDDVMTAKYSVVDDILIQTVGPQMFGEWAESIRDAIRRDSVTIVERRIRQIRHKYQSESCSFSQCIEFVLNEISRYYSSPLHSSPSTASTSGAQTHPKTTSTSVSYRQTLVWKLSNRTLKQLRPTHKFKSQLPTIVEVVSDQRRRNNKRSVSLSRSLSDCSDWSMDSLFSCSDTTSSTSTLSSSTCSLNSTEQ